MTSSATSSFCGNILIVDDLPANLQLLSDILLREGYAVRAAPDGRMALKAVAQRLPDLILLDVKMPEMDGLEVCRLLKENPASRHVPVIFLSAYQETADKLAGFAAGGVDYIGKPFIAEEVLARVRTHVSLYDLQVRLEERVMQRTRALRMLSAGNLALAQGRTEPDLLEAMARVIVEQGQYPAVRLRLISDEGVTLRAAEAGDRSVLAVAPLDGFGRPPALRGLHELALDGESRARFARFGIHALLTLHLGGDTLRGAIGVLTVFCAKPFADIAEEERALLVELAGNLSYGLTALAARRKLEQMFEQTIQVIAATVEKRDPYTAGHQRRVAGIATAIARQIGMDEHQIKGVYLASIIHDIGKIGVPVEILTRSGKLSSHEMGLIQEHPRIGHDVVKEIEFPWPVPAIILQHHERIDGSGYPFGLKDNEIVPEAKIVAVADVLDAISSHRPYRPALGMDVAIQELLTHKGALYDPGVVEACIAVVNEGGVAAGP